MVGCAVGLHDHAVIDRGSRLTMSVIYNIRNVWGEEGPTKGCLPLRSVVPPGTRRTKQRT